MTSFFGFFCSRFQYQGQSGALASVVCSWFFVLLCLVVFCLVVIFFVGDKFSCAFFVCVSNIRGSSRLLCLWFVFAAVVLFWLVVVRFFPEWFG